ncbi:AMP-binding protein [Variovorax sp. E3]|uniref:AMP-binding protein n=1 Tax=Variovorax sp. E3 TaxID=1914993 RepID=UPI0018DC9175|nr:AMP-binding protein [Variovorax sp. E3]
MSDEGNFYDLFARHVREDPGAPCLETPDGEVWTRRRMDAQSARYANALAQAGCTPGDRVAVQVEKSPQALALYLACVRAGYVFLPLNTAYQPAELAYLISDAQPRVFIHHGDRPEVLERLDPGKTPSRVFSFDAHGAGSLERLFAPGGDVFRTVPCHGDEVAALLYTSGTTGRPKGAMLSHRAMSHSALTLMGQWQFSQADVLLHALPIFHGHGLFISSNVALVAGARLLFQPRFDAGEIVAALPRATVFMGVPTYYHRLLADDRLTPASCDRIRLFTSGSAALSAEIHSDFETRTGHRIVERYGATETMILCSNPLDGERRPGSVGLPLPGVELRIADAEDQSLPTGTIGMIQVRGPGLFNGYWALPEQTRQEFSADGYFRTGDLGCFAADGYVAITGRAKDLIISGGYNVYPAEVETAIDEVGNVLESAVVAMSHPDFGEAVVAFVVPVDPATPPTPIQIIQWCKARLANYKVPKQVHIVGKLPRNTMGKILKAQLRAWLTEPGPALQQSERPETRAPE